MLTPARGDVLHTSFSFLFWCIGNFNHCVVIDGGAANTPVVLASAMWLPLFWLMTPVVLFDCHGGFAFHVDFAESHVDPVDD